jgi:glycerophosphoryl diester phosphodiesterase
MKLGYFYIAFLLFACKQPKEEIQNLPIPIGHGGDGIHSLYPMNTAPSILHAFAKGAQGCEIDVQLSRDSVLIAYHHPRLDKHTAFKGILNAFSSQDLQSLHYTEFPFTAYSLATLSQLYALFPKDKKHYMVLDCKLYPDEGVDFGQYRAQFASAIYKYSKEVEGVTLLIESDDTLFLRYLSELDKGLSLYLYTRNWREGIETLDFIPIEGLSMDYASLSKEQVKEIRSRGLKVAVWNVKNAIDNKNAMQLHPHFIQSDAIRDLVQKVKPSSK